MSIRNLACVALLGLSVACGKKAPGRAAPSASGAAHAATAEGEPAPRDPAVTPALSAGVAWPPSATPPDSFDDGAKVILSGAGSLGCEGKSKSGWLALECKATSTTGGHPVKATPDGEGTAGRGGGGGASTDGGAATQKDEQGELRVVLPFGPGVTKAALVEWTDTTFMLRSENGDAKLEWRGGGPAHRKACGDLLESQRKLVTTAKAATTNPITAGDVSKLPRFGVCLPAGHASYALGVKSIRATGEGEARTVKLDVEVVAVAGDGAVSRAAFGAFEFAPSTFWMPGLQLFDFDDDGTDEPVVSHQLEDARAAPPVAPGIFTIADGRIAPYAKSPPLAAGGFGIEQLDHDMRPDVWTYGPFVAWPGKDCSASGKCPTKLTGPRFFYRSMPDGTFSGTDDVALTPLRNACPKKTGEFVVDLGGQPVVAETAKRIACARAWGMSPDAIRAQLATKHAVLCGSSAPCPLATTLEAWAAAPPPTTLTVP